MIRLKNQKGACQIWLDSDELLTSLCITLAQDFRPHFKQDMRTTVLSFTCLSLAEGWEADIWMLIWIIGLSYKLYAHLPTWLPQLPHHTWHHGKFCRVQKCRGEHCDAGPTLRGRWRMNRSKNTSLKQRIPWILSPSSLWCEWPLSLVDLGCEAEK